jgi:4-hydroxy-tetrahydrodipicolinate synthase
LDGNRLTDAIAVLSTGRAMISSGLFAALPTPVLDDGRLDLETFDRLVDFVCGAGVDGICVGGATSEYPHFEVADRIAVIRRASARLPADRALLVAIGASSMRRTIELGAAARDAGSGALLLPMPMFFNYDQDDLAEYCRHVARTLRWPCLLYDLPDFTNALRPDTVISLMRDEEFIVGIKDSSGEVPNLTGFAGARAGAAWTLFVGDDRLLHKGLEAGWNGGISGIAACCPELLTGVYRTFRHGDAQETVRLQALVDEFVGRLIALPAPWAIRMALAVRGFDTGPLPLPLSARRQRQIEEFQAWFRGWNTGC